jgi:hypothetical protein
MSELDPEEPAAVVWTHGMPTHRIYVIQCSTSVKTLWRAFYGDLYMGRFLAEADTRNDAIAAAKLRIEDEINEYRRHI